MRKIFSVFTTIKRNWKKSLFITVALGYGINFGNVVYNNTGLMKKYCIEAAKFGDVMIHPRDTAYRIVVVLNPKANKSNALVEYEKYCSPLLHLSGIQVSVVLTNNETEIRTLMGSIPLDVDALIIAGGNGTISEGLTGLIRRVNGDTSALKNLPIGILPLGKTNTLARKLYSNSSVVAENDFIDASPRVRLMAEAAFAAISNRTKGIDIMRIENTTDDTYRPVYSLNDVTWGSFRDAHVIFDKYRYFVKLRSYLSYVFGSYKRDKPVVANVTYYTPCTGCKRCYQHRSDLNKPTETNSSIQSKRWWQVWLSSPANHSAASTINYDVIDNPSCRSEETMIETINLTISPTVYNNNPCLVTSIGPSEMSYTEFVKEGWKSLRNFGHQNIKDCFYARELVIEPIIEKKDDSLSSFSIDDEEYDTAQIKVTLLKDAINVFRSPLTV